MEHTPGTWKQLDNRIQEERDQVFGCRYAPRIDTDNLDAAITLSESADADAALPIKARTMLVVLSCIEDSVSSFLQEQGHVEDECPLCLDLGSVRYILEQTRLESSLCSSEPCSMSSFRLG